MREWTGELLGRWRWIVGGLVAGLLLGGLVTALTPATYAATTTLYVSPGIPTATTDDAYQGSLLSEHRMKSYVELLTGTRIANDVVEDLGLVDDPEQVAGRITAVAQPETLVLTVTAAAASADEAAELANGTAASFGRLVNELEQTPAAATPPPVRVQVVQAAEPSATPVAPSLPVNLVVGGLLGLLAGFGAAALRRAFDDSVRSTHVLQEVLGTPVLGVLPLDRDHQGTDLLESSAEGEAYRRLRTNLHHRGGGLDRRVLLVASPARGDGRSTLVRGVAAAMSASGSRVLVIDADLRRPALTEQLGLRGRPGLTDVLAGACSLAEAVRRSPGGSFDFLGSGPAPLNASELVGSQQLADLVEELRHEYGAILLDSPPLLDVADGAELAAVADGTIMACRFGVTTSGELDACGEILAGVSATLLGAVVTMAPERKMPGTAAERRPRDDAGDLLPARPVLADTLRPARRRQREVPSTGAFHPDAAQVAGSGGRTPAAEPDSPNHHGALYRG